MYAVGVDISDGWSTVAVLRSKTDIVIRPFNVTHNSQGFAHLLEKLGTLDGEVRVVMEHTGNYYESIANVLHESGSWVSAVNPLLIKNYGDNSLHSVKIDKTVLNPFTTFMKPGILSSFMCLDVLHTSCDS